jgi:dTDP-4-dehydrorhamnose 3,5-epimerase
MNIQQLEIPGLALIECKRFTDDRGFFTERFRADLWKKWQPEHGGFIQDNYSWSKVGVLRGLHYQLNPGQGKLVTCLQGRILDVAVDLRRNSPTFGKHFKLELDSQQPRWLWIPVGFAHGFVVLSPEGAGVMYKVDAPYAPASEGSIVWNDPKLAIDWGIREPILSDKDRVAPSFADSQVHLEQIL